MKTVYLKIKYFRFIYQCKTTTLCQMQNEMLILHDFCICEFIRTYFLWSVFFQVWDLVWDNSETPRYCTCDSHRFLFPSAKLLHSHVSRMKDTNKKNNIFAQFRKNDRDKQKLIETVVKQLRSLVNGMSQHT